jgi:hypothetical protein
MGKIIWRFCGGVVCGVFPAGIAERAGFDGHVQVFVLVSVAICVTCATSMNKGDIR